MLVRTKVMSSVLLDSQLEGASCQVSGTLCFWIIWRMKVLSVKLTVNLQADS
jgi:hypothetical protein